MKILDVSPKVVLPPNTGSRVRMYNLLRHLSAGHQVRQFSQQRNGRRLREHVNEVWVTPTYCELQYAHPAITLIANLAEARRVAAPTLRGAGLRLARPACLKTLVAWADVVLVEFPWQFAYCSRHRGDAPLVLASHNVEAERFASVAHADRGPGARHRWEHWIERVERAAVLGADLVLAVSPEDRVKFVDRYGVEPSRIVVIPNGADTARYAPLDPAEKDEAKRTLGLPERPTILYMGSDTAPNRAGLRWVRRLAQQARHLSFVVVGELSAGVKEEPFFAPGVVNDVAPFLDAADIAICPIEFGGGTKIKLLEAMAAGLPTVAFEETVEGLRVRSGEHLVVLEKDEQTIVAALEGLAADANRARRIGSSGRDFVCRFHDWAAVAQELERTLLGLLDARARPAHADLVSAR